MARLWSSGFELNSLTDNVEWTDAVDVGGSATATISSSVARSGAYSFRSLNTGTSGFARCRYDFASTPGNGAYYVRAYIYITDYPSGAASILSFYNTSNSLFGSFINMSTSGQLFMQYGNGNIGSSSSALSLNEWHMINLSFQNNAGSIAASFSLNGVVVSSTAAASGTGGATAVNSVYAGVGSAVTSYDIYFDDIAINDSTGSFQNTAPGEGKIVHIKPSSDVGGVSSPTITRGGADSGSNFGQVDEVTPNDATDYLRITTTGASGGGYRLGFPTPSSAGINASDTINLIQAGSRFRNQTAGGSFNRMIIRSVSTNQNATDVINTNTTAWFSHRAAPPYNYLLTSYVNPDNSLPWTPTGTSSLTTARLDLTNASGASGIILDYTSGWLLVEYQIVTSPSITGISSLTGISTLTL